MVGLVAVLALATLAATNESIRSGITGAIIGAANSLTGSSTSLVLSKAIDIEANLSCDKPIALQVASDAIVNFSASDVEWAVGKEKISFLSGSLISVQLANFSGKLNTTSGLSLEGSAARMFVNGVAILPNESSLTITVNKLPFDIIDLSATTIDGFEQEQIAGKIAIANGETVTTLTNGTIQIGRYTGKIQISPSTIVFSGQTEKIFTKGIANTLTN